MARSAQFVAAAALPALLPTPCGSTSSSRASSDERWDIQKKPWLQADALHGEEDRNAAMTMRLTTNKEISKPRHAVFAGPSFVAPEPCMLPLPKFLMAR
uniref:Secreted protein n=1 Tax=Oryza nivara TaxID=4536 RepID=A0A0E0HEW6_ORYNI